MKVRTSRLIVYGAATLVATLGLSACSDEDSSDNQVGGATDASADAGNVDAGGSGGVVADGGPSDGGSSNTDASGSDEDAAVPSDAGSGPGTDGAAETGAGMGDGAASDARPPEPDGGQAMIDSGSAGISDASMHAEAGLADDGGVSTEAGLDGGNAVEAVENSFRIICTNQLELECDFSPTDVEMCVQIQSPKYLLPGCEAAGVRASRCIAELDWECITSNGFSVPTAVNSLAFQACNAINDSCSAAAP